MELRKGHADFVKVLIISEMDFSNFPPENAHLKITGNLEVDKPLEKKVKKETVDYLN